MINLDAPIGALKTQLSKLLLSVDRVGWNTGHTNGRFDVRRTSRMLAGSERVFKQRTETPAVTTAVSIIIDLSGSMCDKEMSYDGEKWTTGDKMRIEVASECAWAIAQAVDRSNCDVEVVGFGSGGDTKFSLNDKRMVNIAGDQEKAIGGGDVSYKPTKLIGIKAFSQSLASRRKGFEQMDRACNYGTADYQAIRSVTERLSQRPEQRKIVIVMTDGYGDIDILRRFCEMSEKLFDIPILALGILTEDYQMKASYKRFVSVKSLADLAETAIRQLIDQIKK